MIICTAPDEGSSFSRIYHFVFCGCFGGGLAGELVVDVADVVAGACLGGSVRGAGAVAVEDEGPAGLNRVGMVPYHSMRQAADGFRELSNGSTGFLLNR
jgi:hypothetical protein